MNESKVYAKLVRLMYEGNIVSDCCGVSILSPDSKGKGKCEDCNKSSMPIPFEEWVEVYRTYIKSQKEQSQI